MLIYILKRLVYLIFVFVVLSILIFFIYNLVPGDPARDEVYPLKAKLSQKEYNERYKKARKDLGLDDPIPVKYTKWFSRLIKLDLGMSNFYKQPVKELLMVPLKNTIFINIFVTFFGLLITIPLGIAMAVHKNTAFDRTIQVLTLVGISIPSFITALLMIYLFAVKLDLFPVSGFGDPDFAGKGWWAESMNKLKYIVLPVTIMVVGSLAHTTRFIRSAMVESLSMDYIKTARAKGVKEKTVIYSHAWRNALLPIITLLIGWIASIFSGSIIIESMFGLKGMGNFLLQSLSQQDWYVGLGIQMFYVLLGLVTNLIIDLSYGLVDPRVKVNG